MKVDVRVIGEAGWDAAALGVSLSHGMHRSPERWEGRKRRVLAGLAHKQGGHNKFLESIIVWLDVTAPRYWWQQADTYRLATKQSESTMHTLMRTPIKQSMFVEPIATETLWTLEHIRATKQFSRLKACLPEGFLQRRVWCLSYKTLQNMWYQRKAHRLPEWQDFFALVLAGVEHPEYIKPTSEGRDDG